MRHLISGLVAAVAVMAAAPAMACGYGLCSPCGAAYVSPCAAPAYAAPVVSYSYTNYGGCYGGCGWVTERLPDPLQQYYAAVLLCQSGTDLYRSGQLGAGPGLPGRRRLR